MPAKALPSNIAESDPSTLGRDPLVHSESTVARLFRLHAKSVGRLLDFRLRNTDDAKDAVQDVFVRLLKQEQSGVLREEAAAYMHTTARSVAIDALRHRQSCGYSQQVDIEQAEIAQHTVAHEDALHWRKGVAQLVHTLGELPELTQQVFILYHFEGLSHQEIVARLDVSLRTVERHMARALTYCRERMRDYL